MLHGKVSGDDTMSTDHSNLLSWMVASSLSPYLAFPQLHAEKLHGKVSGDDAMSTDQSNLLSWMVRSLIPKPISSFFYSCMLKCCMGRALGTKLPMSTDQSNLLSWIHDINMPPIHAYITKQFHRSNGTQWLRLYGELYLRARIPPKTCTCRWYS